MQRRGGGKIAGLGAILPVSFDFIKNSDASVCKICSVFSLIFKCFLFIRIGWVEHNLGK